MSNVVDFIPKSQQAAAKNLEAFIRYAKDVLMPHGIATERLYDNFQWELSTWHKVGVHKAVFTAWGSTQANTIKMDMPFVDFAKAITMYRFTWQRKGVSSAWMISLRVLDKALQEINGQGDVTCLNAAICNRACEYFSEKSNAYDYGKNLERIVNLARDKGLLAQPFRWSSPILNPSRETLAEKEKNDQEKLPSRESLQALGEIFVANPPDPLDKVVSSAVALMLSNPCRVGELADIEQDCLFFKESADGDKRMFLRWYAEKIKAPKVVPVLTGMEPVVEEVLNRIRPLTEEAREYAAWLEDNPDTFPRHDAVPRKGPDEPLDYEEICAALKIKGAGSHNSFRSKFKEFLEKNVLKENKFKVLSPDAQAIATEIRDGWDQSKGKRIFGPNGYIQRFEFDDKATITLRKLNVLVREVYLPKHFPYTTAHQEGKARIKFRDALFTVRTGALAQGKGGTNMRDFGVEIGTNRDRVTAQLGGKGSVVSIFERWGYTGVSVNTHAFRHELNTRMHQAGLSQLLIDAFSGRTSMGAVYNHTTIEERTQNAALAIPYTKQRAKGELLQKVKVNEPIKLSDVTDLTESQTDRIIHTTDYGLCTHEFHVEPCPKMGACLTCGKLGCVKGDDVKLANLKSERAFLAKNYDQASKAEAEGEFGATRWREQEAKDLAKCDALIRLLEDPELEDGSIVWNADNGWTLTTNAMAMTGMLDPKEIEQKQEMPSLEDLTAILDGMRG